MPYDAHKRNSSDQYSDMQSQRRISLERMTALIVIALGISSMFYWWPRFSNFSRFAFISCFPAVFPFLFALLRLSGSLRAARIRNLVNAMLVIHCALLVIAILLWRGFPNSINIDNPDLIFVFMAVEVGAMKLLTHLR